jgi:hypothetical protein
MARGRRSAGLAELERKLAQLNAERERVVAAIRAAVDSLMGSGQSGRSAGTGRPGRAAGSRARHFSAASRKRLSELAKARWAKAKKAGQTRLG